MFSNDAYSGSNEVSDLAGSEQCRMPGPASKEAILMTCGRLGGSGSGPGGAVGASLGAANFSKCDTDTGNHNGVIAMRAKPRKHGLRGLRARAAVRLQGTEKLQPSCTAAEWSK